MQFRAFQANDYPALQALDLAQQRQLDPHYDALAEYERLSRLSTSLAALKFYERSEHSFLADDGQPQGFVLAQSVWQGDKPIVLIRTLVATEPTVRTGLLQAVIKSAYDCAVYEVHWPRQPDDQVNDPLALRRIGEYAIYHLGSRGESAPAGQNR